MIRRPIGCRPNTPAEDARRDTGDARTFEYREEAAEAARPFSRNRAYPQYFGCWDLWTVAAHTTPASHGLLRLLRTDGRIR